MVSPTIEFLGRGGKFGIKSPLFYVNGNGTPACLRVLVGRLRFEVGRFGLAGDRLRPIYGRLRFMFWRVLLVYRLSRLRAELVQLFGPLLESLEERVRRLDDAHDLALEFRSPLDQGRASNCGEGARSLPRLLPRLSLGVVASEGFEIGLVRFPCFPHATGGSARCRCGGRLNRRRRRGGRAGGRGPISPKEERCEVAHSAWVSLGLHYLREVSAADCAVSALGRPPQEASDAVVVAAQEHPGTLASEWVLADDTEVVELIVRRWWELPADFSSEKEPGLHCPQALPEAPHIPDNTEPV
jgi:hypothetical protein